MKTLGDIRGIETLDVISDSDSDGTYQVKLKDLCRRLTRKCNRLKDNNTASLDHHRQCVAQLTEERDDLAEQHKSLKAEYTLVTAQCEEYKEKYLYMSEKYQRVGAEMHDVAPKLVKETILDLGYNYRAH